MKLIIPLYYSNDSNYEYILISTLSCTVLYLYEIAIHMMNYITWIITSTFIFIIIIRISQYICIKLSLMLWDPTASIQYKKSSYLTSHIDIGWIIIFIISIYLGYKWFGHAKSLDINYRYYRYPTRDTILVWLWLPLICLLLTIILICIMQLIWTRFLGLYNALEIRSASMHKTSVMLYRLMIWSTMSMNIALYNLIPLPGLSTHLIILYMFPRYALLYKKYYMRFYIITMLAIVLLLRFSNSMILLEWISSSMIRILFMILSHVIIL